MNKIIGILIVVAIANCQRGRRPPNACIKSTPENAENLTKPVIPDSARPYIGGYLLTYPETLNFDSQSLFENNSGDMQTEAAEESSVTKNVKFPTEGANLLPEPQRVTAYFFRDDDTNQIMVFTQSKKPHFHNVGLAFAEIFVDGQYVRFPIESKKMQAIKTLSVANEGASQADQEKIFSAFKTTGGISSEFYIRNNWCKDLADLKQVELCKTFAKSRVFSFSIPEITFESILPAYYIEYKSKQASAAEAGIDKEAFDSMLVESSKSAASSIATFSDIYARNQTADSANDSLLMPNLKNYYKLLEEFEGVYNLYSYLLFLKNNEESFKNYLVCFENEDDANCDKSESKHYSLVKNKFLNYSLCGSNKSVIDEYMEFTGKTDLDLGDSCHLKVKYDDLKMVDRPVVNHEERTIKEFEDFVYEVMNQYLIETKGIYKNLLSSIKDDDNFYVSSNFITDPEKLETEFASIKMQDDSAVSQYIASLSFEGVSATSDVPALFFSLSKDGSNLKYCFQTGSYISWKEFPIQTLGIDCIPSNIAVASTRSAEFSVATATPNSEGEDGEGGDTVEPDTGTDDGSGDNNNPGSQPTTPDTGSNEQSGDDLADNTGSGDSVSIPTDTAAENTDSQNTQTGDQSHPHDHQQDTNGDGSPGAQTGLEKNDQVSDVECE